MSTRTIRQYVVRRARVAEADADGLRLDGRERPWRYHPTSRPAVRPAAGDVVRLAVDHEQEPTTGRDEIWIRSVEILGRDGEGDEERRPPDHGPEPTGRPAPAGPTPLPPSSNGRGPRPTAPRPDEPTLRARSQALQAAITLAYRAELPFEGGTARAVSDLAELFEAWLLRPTGDFAVDLERWTEGGPAVRPARGG